MMPAMKIITPQTKALGVAKKWRAQYFKNGAWMQAHSGDTGTVYQKLLAAGDEITPDQVREIIGNSSWTRTTCDYCSAENAPVARANSTPCLGGETAHDICLECAKEVAALLMPEIQVHMIIEIPDGAIGVSVRHRNGQEIAKLLRVTENEVAP